LSRSDLSCPKERDAEAVSSLTTASAIQWNEQRGEGAQLLTMRHFPDGAQGQSYWYHYDGRGSVAGITKHQGQSTHNYRYDAYGQLLPAKGNWTDPHNHYTFAGKEWDEHLDSYEFGYRLYDPTAGLWLTRDPLRGEPQRPRTLHRYAYAFASPISYRDPYGLQVRPGDCEPGEICHTGTTEPYNVRSPSASAPTGAVDESCYIVSFNPRVIQSGVVKGGVFIGEPPWVVPETDPDLSLAPGWLGTAEGLLDLFYTFVEPYAHANYLETQEPNVEVRLPYTYYEERLELGDVTIVNEAETPLRASVEVKTSAEMIYGDKEWIKSEEVSNLEMALSLRSFGTVETTVRIDAPALAPPQLQDVIFVMPGQTDEEYPDPYVK
jgi:RHS repeat-associated protein